MLVAVLLVLLAAAVAASFVTLPYYALVPGRAQKVEKLITVPAAQRHRLHGQVLLTDVGVVNVKAIDWIPDLFDSNVSLVHQQDLTGNVPVAQFNAEGTVDMSESQITAGAVALRQLGYSVPEHDAGVTVYALDPAGPAIKVLHVGDVITALDGTPTPNIGVLVRVLDTHRPGQRITVRVGTVDKPTVDHTVTLTLGSRTVSGKVVPLLGLGDPKAPDIPGMGTQPVYDMPFPVHVSADNIGGPSAGLAFTLGIIDTLTGGDLTGGKVVAATGTIHPDGTVGAIGGVVQKAVAVRRAGGTVFLVPDANVAKAKAHAPAGLRIMGVGSLRQALHDLQQLGGKLGAAATGPPPGPGGHSVPADWQTSPWT